MANPQKIVELEELRSRLREAEETLAAIRTGEVDALIVSGPHGDQVFSLRGAEQPYRVFVEQMQEGAVTLTEEGIILYANQRFAGMVGKRLEKVIGSKILEYVDCSNHEELADAMAKPAGKKLRCSLRNSTGSTITTQLAFSSMTVDDAEVICLVVTDLTEQEAHAAAEAANRAKDDFLAALSHELRTPLTPVLITASSLENRSDLSPQVREELRMLRRNIELEARLIDDLLDLTRIARGKVELQLGPVNAGSVLENALAMSRDDMHAKEMRLVTSLNASQGYVWGDTVRLQQILWNLIRNAVKFTDSGGVITVASESLNGRLLISISDTGIGIAPEAMPKLFTPFEQTDPLITRRFGGLGLGLAISRKLAELHGGTIRVQSAGRNRGATFTLELPTIDAPKSASNDDQGSTSSRLAKRLNILLVEDHDDTRESIALLLAQKHSIREASNVAHALNAAGKEKFDLVISDVGLPDGSGLELMCQLRDKYGLKGICLSGFGMEQDVSRSVEAGFFRHLTKPIDPDKLEAAIESAHEH